MSRQREIKTAFGAWADMQQQMWDGWQQSITGFGGGLRSQPATEQYRRNMELWQRSVEEALANQAQWSRAWVRRLEGAGAQPPAEWEVQLKGMMQGWNEAQTQLWNAWFRSIEGLDPAAVQERWESEGRQVLMAWQEAAERARETLEQWTASLETEAVEQEAQRPGADG